MDIIYNVNIFCDGGCKRNKKAAFSVLFFNLENFNKTSLIHHSNNTNNIAELSSFAYIFDTILNNIDFFLNLKKTIVIHCDSKYAINSIDIWSSTWIKNNWQTKNNTPVKNREIIENIINMKDLINNKYFIVTQLKHVKAHRKEPNIKNSEEWDLWNYNFIVDNNIKKILN
jgi:ribonuclease HI